MSKRALKMARSMAKADRFFVGKSADAGIAAWLPVATALDEGLRPFEKQLKRILSSNEARLDEMAARTLPGAYGQPQPQDEAYIKSRADALVKSRMSKPFDREFLAPPVVNGKTHDITTKSIHPDWKDLDF